MRLRSSLLLSFIFILTSSLLFAADFQGTWQGVMVRKGNSMEQGVLFYLEVDGSTGETTGLSREELYETNDYSVKKLDVSIEGKKITFKQLVEVKSNKSSRNKWCRIHAELTYNSTTGYLEGDYVALDCRRVMGKLILYRNDYDFSKEADPNVSQTWFHQFIKDFKDGLNAPEIRKIERDNFVFEPIYFDYDESEIRPEHYDFLNRMIKIVKGHSDLRVKVTGHTDADGSLEYNDALSERRANAIIDYFVKAGLEADRLEIDFKGERNPVDTNTTKEGKQRNRRVDFEFI